MKPDRGGRGEGGEGGAAVVVVVVVDRLGVGAKGSW